MLSKMTENENREIREIENGNSKGHSQSLQLKKWCFTLNNYSLLDIEILERKFKEICHMAIFQSEVGKYGTPHLQGSIWLHKAGRWSSFGLTKNIFWSKMRNEKASMSYCGKISDDGWDGKFRFLLNIPEPPEELICIKTLNIYQEYIMTICNKPRDSRTVYWIWDSRGGIGKSQLCRYMAIHKLATVIQGGKYADIINFLYNMDLSHIKTLIIDLPRNNTNKISYDAIECILNGQIFNTKYETGTKIFNPPTLVVLSNFPPDAKTMSVGRFFIRHLGRYSEELFKDIRKWRKPDAGAPVSSYGKMPLHGI